MMHSLTKALLLLVTFALPLSLHAAISGTARSSPQYDNCGTGDWGGASCQVNISGTTGFAANDLIVAVWSRNDDTPDLAPVLPSEGGWTQGPWYGASTAGKIACSVAWKKASGSETTVTPSWSYTGTAQGGKVMAMVIPGTDLNLNALGDSSENEANVASATTSLSSGSASNSTATGLAIAAFCSDNDTDQTGPPTYTNSFTAQATSLTVAYAKTWAATKVLSSAAAQTTTATIVSDEGYGSILVFNAAGGTCPATCAGGRSARCVTDISDASDADNLLYGLSPAATANEDTVCYDPSSVLGDTTNVTAAGWPSIASGGSQLTDSFDYCVMDNGDPCGTDGTYEVTFQPVITSVTGIGTGQTTADITVTPAGPTEGTVHGVAISKTSYDTYGAPSHAQIAAGVDANYDGVAWGSEFTSNLATPDVWTNLATYSEQLDNGAWSKYRTSIDDNAAVAPDGTSTADKVIEDSTAANTHTVARNSIPAAAGITYTQSIYAKAGTRTKIRLDMSDNATGNAVATFDLVAGTTYGAGVGGAWTSASSSIQPLPNGWYRCIMTATKGAGTVINANVQLLNNAGNYTYNGDGASYTYLWGAQLEAASTAGPYTPTVADARARFDGYTFSRASSQTYTKSDGTLGTVTSGNPAFQYSGGTAQGVLLEGARTNLAKYSDDLSNAVWVATNITKGSTSTTGIYGSAITTVEATASAANGTLLQTVTASSAAYTYSTYLKRKTGTGNIDITVNGGTGWTTCTVTASWSPCSVTATVTNPQIGIRIVTSGDAVYTQGSQVEAGSFRSSTIYTTTGSANRVATSLTRSWNFPSNNFSGQMRLRMNVASTASLGGNPGLLTISNGTSNRLVLYLSDSNKSVAREKVVGGSASYGGSLAQTFAAGDVLNIRFRQSSSTGFSIWVDGDAVQTYAVTSNFTSDPVNIYLGAYGETAALSTLSAVVESLTIWNEAKSDAFLEALE